MNKTIKKYGPESVGLYKGFNFELRNPLDSLVTVNPSFCFFMTGPYREFSDPSELLQAIENTEFRKKIEFYLTQLHGPGIVHRNNQGFLEIYQNKVESSKEVSEENIKTCLQAAELVSAVTKTMKATGNLPLLEALVENCSLDEEIKKITNN